MKLEFSSEPPVDAPPAAKEFPQTTFANNAPAVAKLAILKLKTPLQRPVSTFSAKVEGREELLPSLLCDSAVKWELALASARIAVAVVLICHGVSTCSSLFLLLLPETAQPLEFWLKLLQQQDSEMELPREDETDEEEMKDGNDKQKVAISSTQPSLQLPLYNNTSQEKKDCPALPALMERTLLPLHLLPPLPDSARIQFMGSRFLSIVNP